MAAFTDPQQEDGFDARREGVSADDQPIAVALDHEELAAVEGWRAANLVASLPDAVRELVRIGLLSEIAKVQKLVEDIRASVTGGRRDQRPDTTN